MNHSKLSQKYSRYYDAVKYLESLGNIANSHQKTNLKSHSHPEMFLERMQNFLDRLGNPENGFKYIHITGTAGKGSVASLVHSNLVKAGKKAGIFTSPFTVSTIEKIQVGMKYIDPLAFADITEKIKNHIDKEILYGRHGMPSYFEIIFAIALLYFKKERCEYVVLEVGLGGKYDATNIIKKPLITAITNIDLDHTNILGSNRIDIAQDKAGIIKKNCIFISSEEDPNILRIFEEKCIKMRVRYHFLNVKGLDYNSRNILLASSICHNLGIIGQVSDIDGTMEKLPARFEIVRDRPLIIIDGAHNPSKIESTVSNLDKLKYRNLFLVIAISADKDWKSIMKIIAPKANRIYVTRFSVPGRQAVDPKLLFQESQKYLKTKSIFLFSDPIQAYKSALRGLSRPDALIVTGSFYLAGDIRKLLCPEEQILKNRNSRLK